MIVFPTDVESSLSENEGRALAELAEGKIVLELGAWQGSSTICIAQTAKKLFSVDWHHGDPHSGEAPTLSAYWQNLSRYGLTRDVVTIIGRFEDVLPALAPHHFDMVFLDGFHTHEAVKKDTAQAVLLINGHGHIAFHDYGVEASNKSAEPFGVKRAVDEMFGGPSRVVDSLAIVEV